MRKKCSSVRKLHPRLQQRRPKPYHTAYRVTYQLLVVFTTVFDQFSGRFSKEDNSVGFKIFFNSDFWVTNFCLISFRFILDAGSAFQLLCKPLSHCCRGNFLSTFKAPTPRNKNLKNLESHKVVFLQKIGRKTGQKWPETRLKTDLSLCIKTYS